MCSFYLILDEVPSEQKPGEQIMNEDEALEDFGVKMNYFFNKKFFPAAEKQQLLEKMMKVNI